jgi:hypothetical protein
VIITVVQANPNTQPGGVHGAFTNLLYQSDCTPSEVNSPPKASAEKLIVKKINARNII